MQRKLELKLENIDFSTMTLSKGCVGPQCVQLSNELARVYTLYTFDRSNPRFVAFTTTCHLFDHKDQSCGETGQTCIDRFVSAREDNT